ncbi:PREDICTED: A.superbus venom factor 1-like [Nanorana parkeri]|uniref:A.superbus venom factor 1-like n=1 Tax=Nanorana parkeri TaxID=125878 RepID=UPI000854977E|nr:PREDICTED: A.superbus venom factor 1-like [Nanorana parkeri]
MGCRALCLLLLGLLAGSTYGQSCTLITSNVLRVDSEETFLVDGHGTALDAEIIIQDFPKKKFVIAQGRISVNNDNGFLGTSKFLVPSTNLDKDPEKKQFVYVIVRSAPCNLEKVVLVSYQSGYIFIQTDKPLYTPGSTVLYRIFSMTPDLKPINKPVVIEVLTPENVIVKKDTLRQINIKGIISANYKITDLASLGIWTLSAKFEDTALHNFTTHFEVKEYVLPSFEVIIKADKKFYYISDEEFRVEIHANYLYGKPLDGVAYVLFSVTREGEKKSLPDTLERITIEDGEGVAVLKRVNLVKYFQQERDMLQWRLSVSATVITDSGSDMVETELTDIHMVTSPYKVLYTKTSKFFKPGMPMDLTAFVTNPDGSPAHRVPVVAEPGTVRGTSLEDGTVRLTINTRADISSLPITVTTADPMLLPNQQANAPMTATAYQPRGGNFLHLGIRGGELKIGENAAINFIIRNTDPGVQNQITHFNYIILNKGRIMTTGRQARLPGQSLVTLLMPITPEFIPSFRIVAYYVVTTGAGREVVADSVWVDVADTCMGTLTLSGDRDRDNAVQQPGASIKLKLKADHLASVGLVAVDKGVYVLNSKEKISQTKVWESVEKYDTGCTAGGGADAAGVFYDAGLALGNAFHGSTTQRSESLCQAKLKRRRRDTAALIQTKNTKASNYEGLEKTCCEDGMRDLPMKVSCESRATNIAVGEKCVVAFLDCCRHIEKIKEAEDTKDEFGRSDADLDFVDDADIISRSEFPESWLWKIETMNEKPDNGISSKILSVFLKDSITTWEVLAVSLSENKGICVSKPHNIQVALSFFIDLRLPYAVIRNEQVEIRAILYNYGNSKQRVRLEWTYNEQFCSLATSKSKYRQFVDVKPASSVAVPFIIIPLTLGFHDVEVKASGQGISDGVKKKLRVVPEGRRVVQTLTNVVLDPEGKGKGGVQEELIKTVDIKNIVPKTDVETIVTVQGTSISQLVEKSIDGANLNHLITAPWGCGEQNMMSMTPTVISTHYLDATGQWEKVGVQRRTEALQHISNGITKQLTFRKADASYGAWIDTPSSTWLTAYVVKIFALAQGLINVDRNVLCDSVKWLVLEKQKPDGLFEENAPVYHQEMVGGITKGAVELDSTLTAFVLIAMLESEESCTGTVNNLRNSIDKAIAYIEQQYPVINKPYSIAVTSYALARAGRLVNINKLMSASTGNNHWQEPGSHHLSLEASSYALLALLKMKEYEKAGLVVRWLTEQRFHGEVWGSTQSTIMIFQSSAQYYLDAPGLAELEMDVTFKLPGRSGATKIRLNNNNALNARSDQTNQGGNFVVTAAGKGQGTLSAFSVYYAIETEKERQCKNFDLSLKVQFCTAKGPEGTLSTVSLTICTRYLKSQDSGMSILQISMMSGFEADVNDLTKLKRGVDRYSISAFHHRNLPEREEQLKQKGEATVFQREKSAGCHRTVDQISHSEERCLKFNLHQYFKMGLIQPASVTVYDYYSPENRCTKFYHVDEDSKLLGKICVGEVCRCAEANCVMQQRLDNVDDIKRLESACAHGVDYVYKTTLSEIKEENNYFTYVMTITLIIKEGTDVVQVNEKRDFLSHAKCRNALNLVVGQDYMVWGVSKDLWNPGDGFFYMVTRDTWVERWPNARECQQRQYSKQCDELNNFSDELQLQGCPQ